MSQKEIEAEARRVRAIWQGRLITIEQAIKAGAAPKPKKRRKRSSSWLKFATELHALEDPRS
jgi:hypothetical protein